MKYKNTKQDVCWDSRTTGKARIGCWAKESHRQFISQGVEGGRQKASRQRCRRSGVFADALDAQEHSRQTQIDPDFFQLTA